MTSLSYWSVLEARLKLLWLRCGNTSNEELKGVFVKAFDDAISYFEAGNDLVEIGRSSKG